MNTARQLRNVSAVLVSIGVLSVAMLLAGPQGRPNDRNASKVISITVSPFGFAQPKISITAGRYVLVVVNRTGFDNILVYLERMPGTSLTDNPTQQEFGEAVSASRARLVKSAELTAGTYRLRVANRPTWICAIQVN